MNFTRAVALDYAKQKIHCNALCPGCKFDLYVFTRSQNISLGVQQKNEFLIDLKTPMTKESYEDEETSAKMVAQTPWGGWGNPEDVAKVAVFLASDDAAWVTGVPFPVDGGFAAQ